jgi:hypothetical protein
LGFQKQKRRKYGNGGGGKKGGFWGEKGFCYGNVTWAQPFLQQLGFITIYVSRYKSICHQSVLTSLVQGF